MLYIIQYQHTYNKNEIQFQFLWCNSDGFNSIYINTCVIYNVKWTLKCWFMCLILVNDWIWSVRNSIFVSVSVGKGSDIKWRCGSVCVWDDWQILFFNLLLNIGSQKWDNFGSRNTFSCFCAAVILEFITLAIGIWWSSFQPTNLLYNSNKVMVSWPWQSYQFWLFLSLILHSLL